MPLQFGLANAAAFPLIAFVRRHGDKPAAQGARLAKVPQLRVEVDPDFLEDISRILRTDAVIDGGRVDQVLVLIHYRRPRPLIAAQTFFH